MSELNTRLFVANAVAFGGSSKRLARALDVNQRRVQHWLAHDEEPPVEVVEEVERIAKAAKDVQAEAGLKRLIKDWHEAGMTDEAIGARLAAEYEFVLRRTIS